MLRIVNKRDRVASLAKNQITILAESAGVICCSRPPPTSGAGRKFKGSRKLGLVQLPSPPPPTFHERRFLSTYTRIDDGSGGGDGGVVYTHRRGGMALTLPAFNCVPERDPPRLDIRAGVMTREQERRKKENRERHVRYPRHASCTYVPRGRRSWNRDQNDSIGLPAMSLKRCTLRSTMKTYRINLDFFLNSIL